MHFSRWASVACLLFVVVASCVLVSPGNCIATASPPSKTCKGAGISCEKCLENVKCLWCQTNSSCMDYPVKHVLPPSSLCKLSEARWGVCWVNFEALIIAMGVVGGTLLLSIIVCCCCCCCRSRPAGPDRDEERFARRREEIRQRSENRKAERRARHDEIRKKYALWKRPQGRNWPPGLQDVIFSRLAHLRRGLTHQWAIFTGVKKKTKSRAAFLYRQCCFLQPHLPTPFDVTT